MQVSLDEFVKVFKNDKVSDMLMQIIARETEKRHLRNQKAVAVSDMPLKRFDHPGILSQI
jgi:hypothetical protein